jgi:hypothetical protein
MASSPIPSRVTWKDWWAPAAIVITLIGATMAGGGYINELQQHERRITALEESNKQLSLINERTARIEAKLEMIAPPKSAPLP